MNIFFKLLMRFFLFFGYEKKMRNTTPIKREFPIPPYPLSRGVLSCYSHIFNVDYSVQITRVNPLSKEGIFYIKEAVLSGGSIGNDFNFPCDSEHTTHFLLFKYKEIV